MENNVEFICMLKQVNFFPLFLLSFAAKRKNTENVKMFRMNSTLLSFGCKSIKCRMVCRFKCRMAKCNYILFWINVLPQNVTWSCIHHKCEQLFRMNITGENLWFKHKRCNKSMPTNTKWALYLTKSRTHRQHFVFRILKNGQCLPRMMAFFFTHFGYNKTLST